jgi:hypothetical protein
LSCKAEMSLESDKDRQQVYFAPQPEITIQPEVAHMEPTDEDYPDWRSSCPIGIDGEVKQIDMKVIEPYKKVLSHAGYCRNSNFCTQIYDGKTNIIGPTENKSR